MSYAADLTSSLGSSLATLTPHLVSSSSLPTSSTNLTQQEAHIAREQNRAVQLKSILTRLHPGHSISSLAISNLVEEAFPPLDSISTSSSSSLSNNDDDNDDTLYYTQPQTEKVELVTLAQLAISSYGSILSQLIQQATRMSAEDDWWATIESDNWKTGFYLLQSSPTRVLSLATTTLAQCRQMTTNAIQTSSPQPSFLSLSTYRSLLPPSILLASIFPHLTARPKDEQELGNLHAADEASESGTLLTATRLTRKTARSLFFLTLSPLALTRQEIAHKRSQIRKAKEDLARRIGELTLASTSIGDNSREEQEEQSLATLFNEPSLEEPPSIMTVKSATWVTIRQLASALAPASKPSTLAKDAPDQPREIAYALSYLLNESLPEHTRIASETLEPLRRPGFLTRAWPYLLSIPLATAVIGRTVYNSRETILRWAVEAGETTRNFLLDWVVEPVRKILETVRGGEGTGMTLMGRESLKSDLESLERMVVDFGRDEYKLSGTELEILRSKVRDGDMTAVLRAWEKDIKSPLRSAVGGSLIRALLIQVQKVKVDVALAMDGIEKMLRSQQLTFGFVGVAPSLLVVYAVGQWVRGLMRTDGGKKRAKEHKRKCWMTMRQLDLLLSPPRDSAATSSPAMTQGLLLLSLSTLRQYANSKQFPSHDTQLRTAFLEDIRALEDEGARAKGEARRVLLARMWRWGSTLGWTV